MRTYLTKSQIQEARLLLEQGYTRHEIGLRFKKQYGVCKTTPYRHLNEDPGKYAWHGRSKEPPPIFQFVQWAKSLGYTSLQIAEATGIELRLINQAWI